MAVDLEISILVVDDNKSLGQIVRKLLMLIGFRHVDTVFDGASALARLRGESYGLVISDWNMQPFTGLMLLNEVRADPALQATPFLVMSAESTHINVLAAKEAGASNYIAKPFSGQLLKQKIESMFVAAAA
jgi:two-component system, chemotaxis family, chemotaxis protein CheY